MSIIRYNPQNELSNWIPFDRLAALRDEVDRLFDFSAFQRDFPLVSGWAPALDVSQDNDNLYVVAELPGMKKEEIDISLHEESLTIRGERQQEESSKESGFRSERFFGKFSRSVTLPTRVDAGKVAAAYKDGLLTITLPKAEEVKPKQIEVQVS